MPAAGGGARERVLQGGCEVWQEPDLPWPVEDCAGKQPVSSELGFLHRVPCRAKQPRREGCGGGEQRGCGPRGLEGAESPGAQPPHPCVKLPAMPGLRGQRVWGAGLFLGAGSVPGEHHRAPTGKRLPGAISPLAGDVAWSWGQGTRDTLHPRLIHGQSALGSRFLCSPSLAPLLPGEQRCHLFPGLFASCPLLPRSANAHPALLGGLVGSRAVLPFQEPPLPSHGSPSPTIP